MVKETNPTPSARDRYYVSMALPVQPGAHHVIETLRAFDLGWLD